MAMNQSGQKDGNVFASAVNVASPPQMPMSAQIQPFTNYGPDLSTYSWGILPEGTVDPRMQFREPTSQAKDEDDVAVSSSTVPPTTTFHNPADFELLQQQLDQRRRSSAGIWATAFNNMSLQDPNGDGLLMPPDPYTASVLAHQHQKQLHELQRQVLASAAAAQTQTQSQHHHQMQKRRASNVGPEVTGMGGPTTANSSKGISPPAPTAPPDAYNSLLSDPGSAAFFQYMLAAQNPGNASVSVLASRMAVVIVDHLLLFLIKQYNDQVLAREHCPNQAPCPIYNHLLPNLSSLYQPLPISTRHNGT